MGHEASIGSRRPQPIGVVERRAERVVHREPGRDRQHIVHDAQPTKKEGLALEVILDPAARVVIGDVGARLAPLHRKERPRAERYPAPLPEGAGGLDAVGDSIPLTLDCRFIAAAGPVDGLDERALDVIGQQAVQQPDVNAIGGPVRLDRGGEGSAQRSQEEGHGQHQKFPAVDGLPRHASLVHLF